MRTIKMKNNVYLLSGYSIVGPLEGKGPLHNYFDYVLKDDTLKEKTFTDNCNSIEKFKDDIPREQIVPCYVEDAMERFIKEKGTSLIKDESYYTVALYKD